MTAEVTIGDRARLIAHPLRAAVLGEVHARPFTPLEPPRRLLHFAFDTSGEAASVIPVAGWYPVVWLTGALSVSLAFANVLPIPGLDGGRVLLVLIEVARRGKRLSPEREGIINLVGFAFVLSLLAIITYFDIGRLFGAH